MARKVAQKTDARTPAAAESEAGAMLLAHLEDPVRADMAVREIQRLFNFPERASLRQEVQHAKRATARLGHAIAAFREATASFVGSQSFGNALSDTFDLYRREVEERATELLEGGDFIHGGAAHARAAVARYLTLGLGVGRTRAARIALCLEQSTGMAGSIGAEARWIKAMKDARKLARKP